MYLPLLIIYSRVIMVENIQIPGREGLSFVQIIPKDDKSKTEYVPHVKDSAAFINVNSFSKELFPHLARYPPTLILLIRPTSTILEAFQSLTRHVILVQGMDCELVPPSEWGVGLYCENNAGFVEKYKVGGHIIRNEVDNVSLGTMASTRVMRRADLMGW